jgi:type II secretory pathway pseudopilin PulG
MRGSSTPRGSSSGFTLLEICTALVIIFILATLLIPALEMIRMRMEKASCINNLRQLYVAANGYMQDHGHWPQVNPALLHQPDRAYDEAWIEDFMPYGLARLNWICPTMQRDLGGPDYTQPANYRADYVAMPFDSKRMTPYKLPFYPWFVERGNPHGGGNLMVLANGSATELSQIVPNSSPGQ